MRNALKALRAKKASGKGFTLMEMLVVVAIIAILVVISIPVFNAKLEEARIVADTANVRSAKALAAVMYLSPDGINWGADTSKEYYFDNVSGALIPSNDAKAKDIVAYGKAASEVPGATGEPKGMIIKVTIKNDGTVEMIWTAVPS